MAHNQKHVGSTAFFHKWFHLRGSMICLVGVDGSGKTTQARNIQYSQKARGRASKYVWFRSAYLISLPFMAICRILGFANITEVGGQTVTEHKYHSKPIALVWPWIQLVDILIHASLRVYLPLIRNSFVVCDRFVHDILVDIMIDISDPQLYKKTVGQLMIRTIPSDATVILFDVDEKTAFKRKHDIPNLRYLSSRRKLYRSLAAYLNIPIIEATSSKDSVYAELINYMDSL